MALKGSGRLLGRGLAFAGVAAAGYVFGITSEPVAAQPGLPGSPPAAPAPAPMGGAVRPAQPQPVPEPDRRVVGYIYGNVPVTREELGDFLIARGGHEKLELLCNKKIIEIEAARRGITVTSVEISAGLEEDLRGLGIPLKDFEKHVLPKYNKSLYEWVEDVIKPKLLLTKMCKDRVKVTEEDIKKEYENRFGERRQAKIICWSKEDLRAANAQWDIARKGDAEFDAIAKQQADPNLAAACGLVKPVGRHPEGQDETVVKTLYSMKVGEISGILEVKAGLMCIKCVAVVPAEPGVTFDDKMKAALHRELFEKRLSMEIPKFFQELKTAAAPNLLLKGPPSATEFREGVNNIVKQTGGPPPGVAPMPMKP
jgi:hypothetical protein